MMLKTVYPHQSFLSINRYSSSMWDFRRDCECSRSLGASQSSLLASFCVSAPIGVQLIVCWLLIGREGGRCYGHGESTRDFSNHPTNVINIRNFVPCFDSVCSLRCLDGSLWTFWCFLRFVLAAHLR